MKRGNGNKNFTYFCNGPFSFNSRSTAPMESGETHLNPNTGRTLHDEAPVSPSRDRGVNNNSPLNYLIDFSSHNFIRLGLTRTKALQTVSRFPRETRRRYAAPKSNAFTLPME